MKDEEALPRHVLEFLRQDMIDNPPKRIVRSKSDSFADAVESDWKKMNWENSSALYKLAIYAGAFSPIVILLLVIAWVLL